MNKFNFVDCMLIIPSSNTSVKLENLLSVYRNVNVHKMQTIRCIQQ